MQRWIAVGLCLLLAATAAPTTAQAGDASGIFASQGRSFEIVDAYAFRGESIGDGRGAWIVAVSNKELSDREVDRYVDRRHVLDQYFRDVDTAVIFFELGDDASLAGVSYEFGAEDACRFCQPEGAEADVEITGRRIAGTLKWLSDEGAFDLVFDVAISSRDHGNPLPEDGGEPGRAYRVFHQAARSRDTVSLRMAFSRSVQKHWAEAEEAGQSESYLDSWLADHMTEIDTLRGWSRGEEAVLVVRGRRGGQEIEAEVLLVREDGSWRVDDELVRLLDEEG